ncbi:MAG: tyrosine-type recombinase/integrase [Kofleriaceae bacterium]
MVGRKNKPTEVRSKNIIFELHLKLRFGEMRLDEITTSEVARFRAFLVQRKLSDKRVNILAVLSKPLKYAVDCELIAKATTTPKGRTRRTIPMTSTLYAALKRMSVVPEGLVVRNFDGSAKTDDQVDKAMGRICRRAHSFGTHAALFGVNPWTLQTWFGHKRIDETMWYVHVASAHHRELPECVQPAAQGIGDPDRRVLAMLGARGSYVAAAASEEKEVRVSA